MVRLHLDTDLGGDLDDLFALALLLRWPEIELTGITTTAEAQSVTGPARALADEVEQNCQSNTLSHSMVYSAEQLPSSGSCPLFDCSLRHLGPKR